MPPKAKQAAADPVPPPLAIVWRKADDLIPYVHNARTHSDAQVAQIAASLLEFGWTNPVLTDGESGIIAGHGRIMAATRIWGLGKAIPNVPTGMVPTLELGHLTPAQRRAYVLADNQLATLAGWDEGLLALELGALAEDDFPLELIGFPQAELERLLAGIDGEAAPGGGDEDAVPEPPENPVTTLGMVWVLGRHRLVCGDCTQADVLAALLRGERCDLLHTDPPYGVDYKGGRKKWDGIANDAEGGDGLVAFLADAFASALIGCKEGAPWYVWHAFNRSAEFYNALASTGRSPSSQIVWVKNIMAGGFGDYRARHEPCIYCSGGKGAWYGGRDKDTVWEVKRERDYQHPTQKPVELVERALLNSSKAGDVVLDLFGGSGSTLIAAEKHGRAARLVELDPRYCDVIVKRWQDFTGKEAVLEGEGRSFREVSGDIIL